MQKQREESYEEATVWNDVDDGADGYAQKRKKKKKVRSIVTWCGHYFEKAWKTEKNMLCPSVVWS